MQYLKQSTAVTVRVGPFVDDTDGKTAETALTIAQADVRLSKTGSINGQQKNEATSATHDENGYYRIPLDATDTGTAGNLRVCVSKAGALPVFEDYLVLSAGVYDSLIAGTASLGVNVTSQADIDFGATQKASIAAAVPSVTEIQSGLATAAELAKVPKSDGNVSWNAAALGDITARTGAALDEANTELAAVPGAASGLRQMIQFLFQRHRYKRTVTNAAETLYKADGATVLGAAALSDDGETFTKGGME